MSTTLNTTHRVSFAAVNGYIHFTCSSQPTAELRSYGLPTHCPFCRRVTPIKQIAVDESKLMLKR